MADNKLLEQILKSVQALETGQQGMQASIQKLEAGQQALETGQQGMQASIQKLEAGQQNITKRLDLLEFKHNLTHKRLNELALDIQIAERDTRRDINRLADAQETLIVVLEEKGVLRKAQ